MKEIDVVVTMDCEPTTATSDKTGSGPVDFALSEKAIRGYFDIAAGYGFPVTFFIHPETAVGQPELFLELEKRGACLGLHMHPWKYSTWRYGRKRYMAHYGGLTADEQRSLLAESLALWNQALNHNPLYFRPGTFSANDSVFAVLDSLGFRGGSCSAPGRVYKEINAIWTDAEPDPHKAHPCFRQMRGSLDFANMPLSADFSKLLEGKGGRRMHADFRPDTDWPSIYGITYDTIATNILAQVNSRKPAVPVLNAISHNHYDYTKPSDPACQRFKTMLDAICSACEKAGVKPVGATLATVVDKVTARDKGPDAFVIH